MAHMNIVEPLVWAGGGARGLYMIICRASDSESEP